VRQTDGGEKCKKPCRSQTFTAGRRNRTIAFPNEGRGVEGIGSKRYSKLWGEKLADLDLLGRGISHEKLDSPDFQTDASEKKGSTKKKKKTVTNMGKEKKCGRSDKGANKKTM